jgi:4-diphosphocytidyl-2-C-methyl-D-erythritol kinase
MTVLIERARAKINLTLTVHGRRNDGYHELESLVAFADVGDTLTLHPGKLFALDVAGPFATAIDSENLIQRTVEAAVSHEPRLRVGTILLEKHLPVAAGVGGGSADAAATLRLLARANPDFASSIDWAKIAATIGADVPVCLRAETTVMRGFGERLDAAVALPQLHAVLVNTRAPGMTGKTGQVFKVLAAPMCPPLVMSALSPPWPTTLSDWLHRIAKLGNDLEYPAASLMPAIQEAKQALSAQPGFRIIRLSGAGPTCFAIYPDAATARAVRTAIAAQHPTWWVVATTLGSPTRA